MTSSATPDAERPPPTSSAGSAAGGPRLLRRRRGPDAPGPGELDGEQAAELVRRSAESSRDVEPVSAETAELEERQDDRAEVAEAEAAAAAAAAATERVIAQALATGMTDPDEEPVVRRGLLRRRSGYYSPASARPVADPASAPAASQELKLPRKVRLELERASTELTAAREAAERAAAEHAEQTARAQAAAEEAARGREAAERAARETAVQARTEAQRRTVAEQLASETVQQIAAANAERVRVEQEAREHAAAAEAAHQARTLAEEAALRASLEREAAEANARAQAEAAARAAEERTAAEARAQELAASLEEARAALLEQTRVTMAAQQAAAGVPAAPTTAPGTAPATRSQAIPRPQASPEPRIRPEGVPDLVELRSPSSSAVVTVLLGLAALVAAGIAVYEAYLDRLTTPPGIAASAVTLLLVVVVGRAQGSAGRVWLEHGVLHVEEGASHRRFDLSAPHTKVEMVGRPGSRGWKVLFLRKGMAPYEIDSRLVDPEQLVSALKPWRPNLGGG